eukprot:506410-Hanusia_phi.AAC.1
MVANLGLGTSLEHVEIGIKVFSRLGKIFSTTGVTSFFVKGVGSDRESCPEEKYNRVDRKGKSTSCEESRRRSCFFIMLSLGCLFQDGMKICDSRGWIAKPRPASMYWRIKDKKL